MRGVLSFMSIFTLFGRVGSFVEAFFVARKRVPVHPIVKYKLTFPLSPLRIQYGLSFFFQFLDYKTEKRSKKGSKTILYKTCKNPKKRSKMSILGSTITLKKPYCSTILAPPSRVRLRRFLQALNHSF